MAHKKRWSAVQDEFLAQLCEDGLTVPPEVEKKIRDFIEFLWRGATCGKGYIFSFTIHEGGRLALVMTRSPSNANYVHFNTQEPRPDPMEVVRGPLQQQLQVTLQKIPGFEFKPGEQPRRIPWG